MMKNNSKISILFAMGIVFLFGCLGMQREILPPGIYSQVYLPLNSTTIMGLSELAELTTYTPNNPVAVAKYFPTKNTLIAVYSKDGLLRAWDIGNAKVLFEHDLGITSMIGVELDQSGELVMGAIRDLVQENDYGELSHSVGGITVWNVETGNLVKCIAFPCEETAPSEQWQKQLVSGATLDPAGRWVLVNDGFALRVSDITGAEIPYAFSISNINNAHREIKLFAFDSMNNRYAIAFADGEILIIQLGTTSLTWLAPKMYLGSYEEGSRHEVASLSFSADGQWLARIQDDILTVWKVSSRGGKLYFDHEIPAGKLLAFDQISDMLFIGTRDEIEVWSIKEKKLIKGLTTPGITSLAVSSDNRLLIWGDESGVIHVWGILKSE